MIPLISSAIEAVLGTAALSPNPPYPELNQVIRCTTIERSAKRQYVLENAQHQQFDDASRPF
jgi:hypothetical protein